MNFCYGKGVQKCVLCWEVVPVQKLPFLLSCSSGGGGGGVFSFFKSLTSGKVVTREGMAPVLEKMKEHLIGKNVAADIADKLCNSVATKLDGKVISNFTGKGADVVFGM